MRRRAVRVRVASLQAQPDLEHQRKERTLRVRMLTNITGSRNEEPWPPIGGVVDVPDHEAADLIANRYAEEATDAPEADVEAAVVPSDETTVAEGDGDTPEDSDEATVADGDRPKRRRG